MLQDCLHYLLTLMTPKPSVNTGNENAQYVYKTFLVSFLFDRLVELRVFCHEMAKEKKNSRSVMQQ